MLPVASDVTSDQTSTTCTSRRAACKELASPMASFNASCEGLLPSIGNRIREYMDLSSELMG